MVESVGKPRLLSFILGLVALLLAVGFILYLYSYTSGLASSGPGVTISSGEMQRLFLYVGFVLVLGMIGGYEIGRFTASSNKKRS